MAARLVQTVLLLLFFENQVSAENDIHKKVCIAETSINPALVDKAYEGEFANRRELKCFFKCYYLESGFINEAGEVQSDVIKSRISAKANKKSAYQAIDKCGGLKGSDSCDTAYIIHKCLYDNELMF